MLEPTRNFGGNIATQDVCDHMQRQIKRCGGTGYSDGARVTRDDLVSGDQFRKLGLKRRSITPMHRCFVLAQQPCTGQREDTPAYRAHDNTVARELTQLTVGCVCIFKRARRTGQQENLIHIIGDVQGKIRVKRNICACCNLRSVLRNQ